MEQVETEVSKFENEEEAEELEDDKKKKIKKEKKKEKKKKEDQATVELPGAVKTRAPEAQPALQIPGLKNVKLTRLTQKIMGCVVGEHVTPEAPWTTINKVVVDENLYLHHESSDFLPLKDDLTEYTDATLLVGYDPNYLPHEDDDHHRFYVAVTEEARNEVLTKLEEEKRLAEERLKNSIDKRILPWKSLGSDAEVDASITTNTRPLIQLELETDIDELLKPVRFRDREAEDTKDGYVRIGPGRQEFVGIPKLRVDASVQAVPAVVPNVAQTDPGLPSNVWTQYLYDMKEATEALALSRVKELKPDHVFPEHGYMERSLEYNEYFDLYKNDYPLLVLKESDNEIPHKSIFEEYEAYTDVSHCKNKLISSIAWHPMWSGIVALAYSVAVRCITSSVLDLTGDEVNRDVFSKNVVLLWSFKDGLKPRLILESPREVHSLAWSPLDPNILVGGCASGQIIIWDIKGKLEAVEGHEYLTPDQQRYRLVMQSLIGWLQPQPPAQYVRPAAVSNIQFSHSGKVTQVQWISPHFEWTENGHYVRASVEEGTPSMQVISSGEDGQIRVWDLRRVPEDGGGPGKPRRRKARKRPSALTAQISPFKPYDRKLRPIYILYPELPSEKVATKLTGLAIRSHQIKYKLDVPDAASEDEEEDKMEDQTEEPTEAHAVKSEEEKQDEVSLKGSQNDDDSLDGKEKSEREEVEKDVRIESRKRQKEEDEAAKKERKWAKEEVPVKVEPVDSLEVVKEDSITSRKIYRPSIGYQVEQPLPILQVVTDEGDSITMRWEGFEFQKGEEITTEQGAILSWGAAVHDGPIVTCVRSPFIEDLVLTVGGRVTALWKEDLENQPLFWKYSPVVVTCGSWSPYRPCFFHVGRSDGSIEVWDLTLRSDVPVLVQSISGKVLTTMAEHSLPLYGGSSVLGIADYNNSFRLLYFPEEYKVAMPKELEMMKAFVNKEVYLRKTYAAWNESFLKSNAEELARIKAEEEEAAKKHREAEQAVEQEAQLRAKMEEEEARRLAKGRQGNSLNDRFLNRLKQEREKQMQRVLMEKKQLNKSDLLAKQQPILMIKQMEKEKRKKQRDKIKQQQKIFNKTVAMLFPEIVEKPKERASRIVEFEAELMHYQPELMAQYDSLLPVQLKFVKDNPFNKRLRWEKVFEEGMLRRNVLDFPLYLRQHRQERFMSNKLNVQDDRPGHSLQKVSEQLPRKGKVSFKSDASGLGPSAQEEQADAEEVAEEETEEPEDEEEGDQLPTAEEEDGEEGEGDGEGEEEEA